TPTCSPLLGLLSILCPSPTPTPTLVPTPSPPLPTPALSGKALPVTGDNTTPWIAVAIALVSGGLLVELAVGMVGHPHRRRR
ncbi:MAG TPA: LPXTG cell wall anchor domain-containing protein, partial [Actinomycetota bacterium]|nr:LPXTG cell wall anchor domain-containing protein [Actinomycetota bacterium]